MKVTLRNIGVFKQAEYKLGDFTIICGKNNSGKTYATYSLYGFFDYMKNGFQFEIEDKIIDDLFQNGAYSIDLKKFTNGIISEIKSASDTFSSFLPFVFAANPKRFENSKFDLLLVENEIKVKNEYSRQLNFTEDDILQISKEADVDLLSISFASKSNEIKISSTKDIIKKEISKALKFIYFSETFPNAFIASAERTGISMFIEDIKKNLHHRLINRITNSLQMNINDIVEEFYSLPYPIPISKDIEFNTQLSEITKHNSYIANEHPEILSEFANLLGGEYKVDREGLSFIPNKTRGVKLTMGESSSSVRSLLDVGFYLKHSAQKGDLLMIDEPELNLHPENQRKLARLLVRLVNIGIKVFITTHSDYIIKELNTLIMLNHKKDHEAIINIMQKNHYHQSELIEPNKIRVYIACEVRTEFNGNSRKINTPVLKPAEIDQFYGIEAESFDQTIDEMNSIQKSIIFE